MNRASVEKQSGHEAAAYGQVIVIFGLTVSRCSNFCCFNFNLHINRQTI